MAVSWSGGKDSALALHTLLRTPDVEVTGLLTTVTSDFERVSVHGVRRALLERQAAALGLPLRTVEISAGAGNAEYQTRFGDALAALRAAGTEAVAYGDLFLEDVRAYREQMTERLGMRALFPLWGRDSPELAREVIALGFEAVLACVDTHALDAAFAGRPFDGALLRDLPAGVDPCGENGEFHTFVHRSPDFREPIPVRRGAVVLRDDRFAFCDLE